MTVRAPLTPRAQASLTGGSVPTSDAPAGLCAEPCSEPWYVTEILDAEARAWIAEVDRRCNQATIVVIFFAALWFLTPCIGAVLP